MLCDVFQRSPQRWTTRDLVRRSEGFRPRWSRPIRSASSGRPMSVTLGWLGVQLPEVGDDEFNVICREAFVAPPSVLKMLPEL